MTLSFYELSSRMQAEAIAVTSGEDMRRTAACILLLSIIHTGICLAEQRTTISNASQSDADAAATHSGMASTSSKESEPPEEKWTELNAIKSGLDPSRTAWAVLAKWDFPTYTTELVRVQWRAGDPIDLYVVLPHGVAKPPAILYLYSFPADTDRFREKVWCEFVTKNGFAAVGFVSALTGERYRTRPLREWFISELQESLVTSTHDVQMIVDYLANRGDIDTSKVGMFGEGSGGTIAILAASTDSRLAFVDAINPWGDWPDWLKESQSIPEKERANYLRPEFLQKIAMFDPVAYLTQLKPNRIRVEQAIGDPMTPKSAQAKIAASASAPSNVVEYPDLKTEVHVLMTETWWLKEQLQPSPAPPRTAEVNRQGKVLER